LATAKFFGALVLIIPGIPSAIKQFAYFGFTLTFLSAFVAHTSVGDTAAHAAMPLIFLAILAISYLYSDNVIKLKNN
jgi:hypothetical protein